MTNIIEEIVKEFEEKEFLREFGVKLNTKPINGRIVAEEKAEDRVIFQERLRLFDERTKELVNLLRFSLEKALQSQRADLVERIKRGVKDLPIFGYLSGGHVGNEPLPVISKEQVYDLIQLLKE